MRCIGSTCAVGVKSAPAGSETISVNSEPVKPSVKSCGFGGHFSTADLVRWGPAGGRRAGVSTAADASPIIPKNSHVYFLLTYSFKPRWPQHHRQDDDRLRTLAVRLFSWLGDRVAYSPGALEGKGVRRAFPYRPQNWLLLLMTFPYNSIDFTL